MIKRFAISLAFVFATLPGCGKVAPKQNDTLAASVSTVTIQLPTLKCKTCVKTVNGALSSVEGIESADIDLGAKKAIVKFVSARLDVAKIRTVISNAGYDADDVKRDSTAYENLAECCK